jgi:hypothetical protein
MPHDRSPNTACEHRSALRARRAGLQWAWLPMLAGLSLALLAGAGLDVADAAAPARHPAPPRAAASGATPALRFAPAAMHFHNCCFTNSMAAADLDGDGRIDLVAGNGLSYDVTVLRSDRAGHFAEPVSLPVSNPLYGYVAVAVGDVTGDGTPDIVATGFDDNEALVYANDGSGVFGAPVSFDLGAAQSPRAIALADVDGDGNDDLITANGDSGNVSVLAGDGAGSFAAARNFPTGAFPVALAVADVTGDGKADIVTANAGNDDVSILAGDGTGQFAAPLSLSIGADAEPVSLAVADATGDGIVDIVTANSALDGSPFPPPELPGTVSVLAANGSGGFAAAQQFATGAGDGRAHGVAIADITGDGHSDIVVSRPIANSAAVLAGDGAGGFARAQTFPTSVGPTPLVIADVTGDGHADIVTGNAVSANISVLPGDGAGGIGFAANFGTGIYPHSIAAVDFNGDGRPDVATANIQSNDVSVLLNDGAGGFAPEVRHAVGNSPLGIASADVDGDGHADLFVADLGGGEVSVLLGDGAGDFAAALNFGVGGDFESPYAVAVGDANGDGHLDIATANTNISNDSISLLLGDGSGQFGAPTLLPLGTGTGYQPQGIVFGDVTGDGHADIVTANSGHGDLSLLAGDGAGGFAAAVPLPTDQGPDAVVAADVTGDGIVDLVSLNQPAQDVSVLVGDGSGGFAAAANYPIYPPESVLDYNPWPQGLALADVDADGRLDIVTANTQNDTVSVLSNDGAGGFGTFANFDTGAHPGSIAVADFDGDGQPDLATANFDNNGISVLVNQGSADLIFADGFD